MKRLFLYLTTLLVIITSIVFYLPENNEFHYLTTRDPEIYGPELPLGDYKNDVYVSPTATVKLDRKESVIYTPLFAKLWGELRKEFIKTTPPNELYKQLDKEADNFKSIWLPKHSYQTLSGKPSMNLLQDAELSYVKMFNNPQSFDRSLNGYAALNRRFEFPISFIDYTESLPQPFNEIGGPTDGINNTYITTFGFTPNDQNVYNSFKVIHYDFSKPEYTVKLTHPNGTDAVILSVMDRPETLSDAIAKVYSQLQHPTVPDKSKHYYDYFVAPNISFYTETNFKKLLSLPLPGDTLQIIDFCLTNQGIALKDLRHTRDSIVSSVFDPHRETRRFYFNRPFLCTMWKDGEAMPYLAVWVNGPDVLVKSSN